MLAVVAWQHAEGFDSIHVSDDFLEDRADPRLWFQVDADRTPPSSSDRRLCSQSSAVSSRARTFRGFEIDNRIEDRA
jgi:hypothetical protein